MTNTICLHHRQSCHNPLHCFLPPHILDELTKSSDPSIRQLAIEAIAHSETFRATRDTLSTMPIMAAIPSPTRQKHRLIYTLNNLSPSPFLLPGQLVLSEGELEAASEPVGDEAVKEAYEFSGATYDFYKEVFGRNSLDDNGMSLISTVHVGRNYNNAGWTGEQMIYGDGDNTLFTRFTKSLDVVGHELTHGVVQYTSNLEYQDESGALNEHFADVGGALVKQWYLKQTVEDADWYMGGDIIHPDLQPPVKGIRTFKAEKAYENHDRFGTDPQPKHMRDKYTGERDRGGVHINSGIPNHAFYLVAMELGGKLWEGAAAKIWYETLQNLNRKSEFQAMADMAYMVAREFYGSESGEAKAVKSAWTAVGIALTR
jgi:Zn-dependent metalloprotease